MQWQRLKYVTVDVFTSQRFTGNPVAVILGADGIADEEMQAIAAEFRYSETAFLTAPTSACCAARLRIFTQKDELPFAGHPNIGAAYVVARLGTVFGRPIGKSLSFEQRAGVVSIDITLQDGIPLGATLLAPEPYRRLVEVDPAVVAACVGLEDEDIVSQQHRPIIASIGLPILLTEVRDLESLGRCRPIPEQFARHFPRSGANSIHLYTRTNSGNELQFRARHLSPLDGIWEDPATGSANAALVALLADLAPARTMQLQINVKQGVEMGRASALVATADKYAGKIHAVRIGGDCIQAMEGIISIPVRQSS